MAQKMMVATSSTLHEPVEMQDETLRYSVDEPFRPAIYKWNQRPVFRRLVAPPIVRLGGGWLCC
jgi:hypothetical protein